METGFTHTIDGRAEGSDRSFDVINPATGEVFAQCPDASKAQLDKAVASSRHAFADWSQRSMDERRQHIHRFAAAVRERAKDIAPVLTREQGKPLDAAFGEFMGTAAHLEGLSSLGMANELIRDDEHNRIELRYRPLGVIGAITPWNFPVILAMHKVAQALYAGNTMVLKPSPYTPLSTLKVGEIAREFFPPGVLNVVAGGNDLGRWMAEHPDINMISFTGSVPTGKRVMASVSDTLKRLTLELGGNDAAIVLDDADVAKVTPGLFNGAFYNAGQVCMAIKRVYVPERLYEPVCEGLAEMARSWRVGEGFEPDVQMGPLQNKMQYDKVLGILEDTKQQPGVRILAGGHTLNRPGYFLAPTIVADIDDDSRLVREEQFGPVLPVMKYKNLDEAVRRANNTKFGLSGSVWTSNPDKGAEVAARLEAGTVWVNQHSVADADVPFGGAKESGFGRELGALGLRSYLEPQVVSVSKGTAAQH